ncbi:MAG: penicillin-binding protein [candidate division NC10 bacterium]|nr:penicillin-binding protein [candidate division NC10 bacterium]
MPFGAHQSPRRRIVFLFLLLASSLALITAKLYFLQIKQQRGLAERAKRQYQRVLPLTGERGTIYDRNGKELAVSVEVASVFAQPSQIERPGEVAAKLAAILNLPVHEISKKLSSDRSFVWIQRKIEPAQAQAITALGPPPGIYLLPEAKRYYPKQELAAHLLGFVGLDEKGLEGLEFQYDDYLGGGSREVIGYQDALGRVVYKAEEVIPALPSYDLELTIDEVIQYTVEKELQAAIRRSRAVAGSVIVIDPQTGEVLALANWPTFNPNYFNRYSSSARRNRATDDTYEPGSTFKVIMAAAALEERLVRPQDIFFGENGAIQVAGLTIHDYYKFGWLTFQQVLEQSSNVGAIKVGLLLGKRRYYNYIRDFGFGSRTGIDLPGEAAGKVRLPREWSAISLGSISIGQEVAVTPIQLLAAVSAVANGGFLVKPYLVRAIKGPDGKVLKEFSPMILRRVISDETSQILTAILEGAVKNGTGKHAGLEGYRVAGKTGTSQKLDRATGHYSRQKVVASFVGYVPVEDPRLAILVLIDEPQIFFWGGSIAAPVFREVAQEALKYLKVPPVQKAGVQLVKRVSHEARRLD